MKWLSRLFRREAPEPKVFEPPEVKGYVAPKGAMWNPLLKWPRNHVCWCGSGLKAKFCCLPRSSKCISLKTGTVIKANWNGLLKGTIRLPKAPDNFVKEGKRK